MAFPQTLDPTAPAGSDSPRLGDDQLRALKQLIADVFGLPINPTSIAATIGSVSALGKFTLTNALWNADKIGVAYGGTNLASGTSGGILGFTGATTIASSAALTANALLLGGGAGATPTVMGSLGTTTTLLHGNAAGAPTFGAVSLTADVTGTLPFTNLVPSSAASRLVGRGSAAGAGSFEEVTLGSGLTMSGTTLSSSSGSLITAAANTILTSETTTSVPYTNLVTVGPSVTVTVGPSGILLIGIKTFSNNSAAGNETWTSFALSGGNTLAAADAQGMLGMDSYAAGVNDVRGASYMLSGLTASSTTITMKYKVSGGTGTWRERHLWVMTW